MVIHASRGSSLIRRAVDVDNEICKKSARHYKGKKKRFIDTDDVICQEHVCVRKWSCPPLSAMCMVTRDYSTAGFPFASALRSLTAFYC